MKAIVAVSKNNIIAKDNKIPWYFPDDLKFFKEKTLNQNIIVGRKTFETLPSLPNRKIYVLSKKNIVYDNAVVIDDISQAPKNSWLCGGAEIYNQYIHLCDELFYTDILYDVSYDYNEQVVKFNPFCLKVFNKKEIVKRFDTFNIWRYFKSIT